MRPSTMAAMGTSLPVVARGSPLPPAPPRGGAVGVVLGVAVGVVVGDVPASTIAASMPEVVSNAITSTAVYVSMLLGLLW